jgi:hypothetical protein
VSEDYQRGRRGEPAGDWPNAFDYQKGVADRQAAQQPGEGSGAPTPAAQGHVPDTEFAKEAGRAVARVWLVSPNKAVRQVVRSLVIWTAIFGAIGAGTATFLGTRWAPSPLSWGLPAAAVAFWLNGAMLSGALVGALIGSRRSTVPATLFVLGLIAVLVVMLWAFLSPMVYGWTH